MRWELLPDRRPDDNNMFVWDLGDGHKITAEHDRGREYDCSFGIAGDAAGVWTCIRSKAPTPDGIEAEILVDFLERAEQQVADAAEMVRILRAARERMTPQSPPQRTKAELLASLKAASAPLDALYEGVPSDDDALQPTTTPKEG